MFILRLAKRHSCPRKTRHFSCSSIREDKKFNVLFLGRESFSCNVLTALHGADDVWSSIDVVTYPEIAVQKTPRISPLQTLGESLDVPVHLIAPRREDFRAWLPPSSFIASSDAPNRLLITASFGRILPSTALNLFDPLQRLNIHPSLLPKYRGPAPIQHAILNGDTETGVSVLGMLKRSEGIDAGPVLGSRKVALPENATFPHALEALSIQSGKLLVEVLREMQAGKVTPTQQTGEPSRAPVITFEDSIVDFKTMTATYINRLYRAISHMRPLTARTRNDVNLQLHNVSIVEDAPHFLPEEPGAAVLYKPGKTLLVRCAEGSAIAVPELKPDSRPLMSARDWWNGVSQVKQGLVEDNKYHFA